ncbi:MAG: GerAB/ArcD/ProY family transporter, partial [Oscillospiraceae bacterium]|nr:GerAB/ArcD/ProY family transporter [Oscillospiraceae bacterium]
MKEKIISNGAGAFLTALIIMTNSYAVLPASHAGRGIWIADILAIILALFLAYLFASSCDKLQSETFYGVMRHAVGKWGATVLGGLLLIITLLTTVVSLTVFSRFVQITALPRTPQIIIPLIIITIAALSLSGELTSSGGAATLLFWFSAFVFILFFLSGIGKVEPHLFLPQRDGFSENFKGTGEVFLNRFGALPALMAIYTRMSGKETRKKYFLSSIAGSGVAIAALSAITVATLGEKAAETDFYPVYTAMSIHSIGGFIQHTEIFACIAMTVSLFFKGAASLMFSEDMINGMFDVGRKSGVSLPLALIAASSTQLIYTSISSLRGLLEWKSGAIVMLLINIAVPVLLF